MTFKFEIKHKLKGTLARSGIIYTPHGNIKTPAFIIGGTKATVKALTNDQIKDIDAQALLANTYHLMLQPGADIIQKAGGLSKFMNLDMPTFTDSGGFQVFSLGMAYKKGIDLTSNSKKGDPKTAKHSKSQLAKVNDKGVIFKSHLDGRKLEMTPVSSMQLQHKIGADIIFAFDELTSPLSSRKNIEIALERTHKWALKSLEEHQKLNSKQKNYQALFGIVQGARELDLREKSAQFLNSLDFDGFGIGGIFEPEEIPQTLKLVDSILNEDKPRHLLGMGSQPLDLFLAIEYGIDTFDCVAPTRQARNGALYTKNGRFNIKNAKYKDNFNSLDEDCKCYTCSNFSLAYLHHLYHSKEILASTLGSIHNEYFVINLVDLIRESIENETFFIFKDKFLNEYYSNDS